MSMVIQNNLNALTAYNKLAVNVRGTAKASERLSSGFRINRAADDAAGLAVSEKMRAQLKGLGQAIRNANDGISLIQTGEGALDETANMLKRLQELAVQSANDTYDDIDRGHMQREVQQILTEITRIATETDFNGIRLFNGSRQVSDVAQSNLGYSLNVSNFATRGPAFVNSTANVTRGGGLSVAPTVRVTGSGSFLNMERPSFGNSTAQDNRLFIQIGNYDSHHQRLAMTFGDMTATGLGVDVMNISTRAGALIALGQTTGSYTAAGTDLPVSEVLGLPGSAERVGSIRTAIDIVNGQRAQLGAWQNRLESAVNNLTATHENLTAAESGIRDTDMASTMIEFTKNNILQQAAQAMLAQANQAPQAVLQLLR